MTCKSLNSPGAGEVSGFAREKAFLTQLDHDLRTPLGTMAAALELLRHEPAGTAMHGESIAVLQRQISRLHSLTDALHEFSQTLGR